MNVESSRTLLADLLRHPAIEYFVPEPYRNLDDVEGYRARILVGISYGLLAAGLGFAVLHSTVFGLHIAANALLVAVVAVGFTPALLRWTERLDWAGNWLSLNVYWITVAVAVLTGGLTSPAAEWLAAVPIYGLLFSGIAVGLGWAVLACATFAVLYALPRYGFEFPQMLGPVEFEQFQAWTSAGLALVVVQLVLLSRWMHEWVIGQLHEVQAELETRALYDSLTDLPNRRSLEERFEEVLEGSPEDAQANVLGLIDLDNFKMINDSIGHPAGDEVLREFGARLDDLVPGGDFVARIGGDEFVLLFRSPEATDDIERLGDQLEEVFDEPFDIRDAHVHLSASIGLVDVSAQRLREADDEALLQALMRSADRAMYAAKEIPGTSWKVRKLGDDIRESKPLKLENRVRRAIEQDELIAYLQPILELADGEIFGAEVLARWNHPERGVLSAGEFIPLAERSDLIEEVGRAVIEDAYRRIEESGLRDRIDDTLDLFVNLSPRQLQVEDAIERVDALFVDLDLPEITPRLEVTEKHWLRSTEQLAELRRRGYSLVVDDFGQGYSSLSRLTELPIDVIKIDRTFVAKMTERDADSMVVELIAELGERLGVPVIAEGIEDTQQLEAVHGAGVTGAQGFHLGRPCSVDDFLDRLEAGEFAVEPTNLDAPPSADGSDSSDESIDPQTLAEGSSVTIGDATGSLSAESSTVTVAEHHDDTDPDSSA